MQMGIILIDLLEGKSKFCIFLCSFFLIKYYGLLKSFTNYQKCNVEILSNTFLKYFVKKNFKVDAIVLGYNHMDFQKFIIT